MKLGRSDSSKKVTWRPGVLGFAFVLLLAAVPRVGTLVYYWERTELSPDERRYLQLSKNIREEGAFGLEPGVPDADTPPLYPAFLALAGAHAPPPYLQPAFLLHLAGGAFVAGMSSWLAGLALGRVAFYSAGFLAATDLHNASFVKDFWSENLALPLVFALAALLARSCREKRHRDWFISGLTLGLCALTRTALLGLVPGALLVVATAGGSRLRERAAACALFALGFAVVQGPWAVRNMSHVGEPVLVSRQGPVEHAVAGWTAHYLSVGSTWKEARKISLERGYREPPPPQKLSSHFHRLAVLLGAHPALERPFPFAGVALGGPSLVQVWHRLWFPTVLFFQFLSIPFLLKRRDAAFVAWVLGWSQLLAHSVTHAIPRYAMVSISLFTVCAGVSVAGCFGLLLKRNVDKKARTVV